MPRFGVCEYWYLRGARNTDQRGFLGVAGVRNKGDQCASVSERGGTQAIQQTGVNIWERGGLVTQQARVGGRMRGGGGETGNTVHQYDGVFENSEGGQHKRVTVSECDLKALPRHTAQ